MLDSAELWDEYASRRYDLILANIVADVISDMLPLFKTCLKDGGTLVCSGIISPRKEFVLDALERNGFKVEQIKEKNEWLAIECRK